MAYTDLTAEFDYRDLVTWSKMDQLAENDAYDRFQPGTRTFFYQASAPAAWTKITTQNDKLLRVVSGAGAGSGGSASPSGAVTLAHSHTAAHTHTSPSHVHVLDYTTATNLSSSANQQVISGNSDGALLGIISGIADTIRRVKNQFTATTPGDTGSATPGTNSQLTNFTLAYADVIICEKN